MTLAPTPSQTIGPFWHLIENPEWSDLTRLGAGGEVVRLTGRILDGEDGAVSDAAVELWQADPPASPIFPGWGRCRTDGDGRFTFTTIKPGPIASTGSANQAHAPHLALSILARGLLRHLVTRAYFEGEALNAQDPLLLAVPDARRPTLIARPLQPGLWRHDIRLQGPAEGEGAETVFLEV